LLIKHCHCGANIAGKRDFGNGWLSRFGYAFGSHTPYFRGKHTSVIGITGGIRFN
jgi:hypothetical protein